MVILVQKETLGLKVSLVLQDSKATLVLRDFQDLKEPSEPLEIRVQQGNQAYQACQELMDLRATQERKVQLVRKVTWDHLEHKDRSDILAPEV